MDESPMDEVRALIARYERLRVEYEHRLAPHVDEYGEPANIYAFDEIVSDYAHDFADLLEALVAALGRAGITATPLIESLHRQRTERTEV